jgi:hypothetical protein
MGQRAAVGVDGPIDLVVLRRPGRLPVLLRGMRPRHWAKNVLVFAAPGAAGDYLIPDQRDSFAMFLPNGLANGNGGA